MTEVEETSLEVISDLLLLLFYFLPVESIYETDRFLSLDDLLAFRITPPLSTILLELGLLSISPKLLKSLHS